jgi:hypothetical protein
MLFALMEKKKKKLQNRKRNIYAKCNKWNTLLYLFDKACYLYYGWRLYPNSIPWLAMFHRRCLASKVAVNLFRLWFNELWWFFGWLISAFVISWLLSHYHSIIIYDEPVWFLWQNTCKVAGQLKRLMFIVLGSWCLKC